MKKHKLANQTSSSHRNLNETRGLYNESISKISQIQEARINSLSDQEKREIQDIRDLFIKKEQEINREADNLDKIDPSGQLSKRDLNLNALKLELSQKLDSMLGDLGYHHSSIQRYRDSLHQEQAMEENRYSDLVDQCKENRTKINNNITNPDPDLYDKLKTKRSLIDTYADLSTEMPDYINED